MVISRRVTALAVVAGSLAAAAPAFGSTQVGQTFSDAEQCNTTATFLQTHVTDGPSYTVPFTGVLTSWSTFSGTSANAMDLKVGRATGNTDEYKIVASDTETPAASRLNTFPVHLRVQAGDVIGMWESGANDACAKTTTTSDTFEVDMGQRLNPNDTATFSPSSDSRFNISATLEPDADGDGFGDETQDACPTDATTQGPCPADLSVTKSASATVATIGDSVTYTLTARNNSTQNPAKNVTLTDVLPAGMTLVSASGASCTAATCSLGTLAPGASAAVTIVARASAAGAQTDKATVAGGVVDSNASNDSATATTTVVPRFALARLHGGTFTVVNNRVRISVSCPATSLGNCVGTDTLTTAGKVKLKLAAAAKKARVATLGKAKFSIAPGKHKTLTIKLTKAGRTLLAKHASVKARETVRAHDSRNVSSTRKSTIKLKRATKKHG